MTARDDTSIAPLLALIEKHGSVVVPAREVEALAPVDARVALLAAGVITAAPAARTWPCDARGCAREVRTNHDGARKPLVAVCTQAPPACEPVELAFDDVAQQQVAVDALVAAACALLGAEVDRAALAALRRSRAIGEARAPVLVATQARPPRDVYWIGAPRDADVAAFAALRQRLPRRTMVLVPTTKHVPLDVASRCTRGERIELIALADALAVRDGALALAADDAPKPRAVAPAPLAGDGVAAKLGATSWEQIRVAIVDGHTLRIEANGRSLLRTFVELGFVDGRKTDEATPVIAWSVLLLLCKEGRLRPSEYAQFGKTWAAKKGVQVLREALRGAFGLEDDPLRAYTRHGGWEPRFRTAPRATK